MTNVTPWLRFLSADSSPGDFGGEPWSNELAALTIGAGEASSGPIGLFFTEQQTAVLRISAPDFAGSLPAEFLLLGVEAEIRGRWEGDSGDEPAVDMQSVVGASVRQHIGSCALPLGPTPGACVKGSPTDTMNFTGADLADPGFGFRLQGILGLAGGGSSGNTLFIDSVRVRIHWAEPAPLKPARSRTRTTSALTRGVLA